MIRNAFISLLLFFVVYNIVFYIIDSPGNDKQNQWKGNMSKVEEYLYEEDSLSTKGVIIGSSLAERMHQRMLPPNMINLGLSGQSLFDGLHVIMARKDKPSVVMIETNVVMRGKTEAFEKEIFNPLFFYAKQKFRTLRTTNQPIGLLEKKTLLYLERLIPHADNIKSINIASMEDTYDMMVGLQKKNYMKTPDEAELFKLLKQIKDEVNELEKQGVCVVFFEMPVSSVLCDLPMSVKVRESFYQEFPVSRYHYIPQPACADYKTRDGRHLVEESADKYTEYLMKELQNIECK